MGKVLVIRKPDRTIHKVPIANKAVLMNLNNKKEEGKKWKIEEMDEEEADKLPFIDENYISPTQAVDKVKEQDLVIADKDNKIAELEAKLAMLNNTSNVDSQQSMGNGDANDLQQSIDNADAKKGKGK